MRTASRPTDHLDGPADAEADEDLGPDARRGDGEPGGWRELELAVGERAADEMTAIASGVRAACASNPRWTRLGARAPAAAFSFSSRATSARLLLERQLRRSSVNEAHRCLLTCWPESIDQHVELPLVEPIDDP